MEEEKKKIKIDIAKLAQIVLADKRKMLIYCGIGAIAGIIFAFSIPRIYKSSVMLAPEETSNGFSGNISSLASMVGMNMKFGDSGDAIYPEIYPDVLESTKFLVSLFPVKVTSKDGKIKDMPYAEYMERHQKEEWWFYPVTLAVRLIERLKGEQGSGSKGNVDPVFITKKQYDLAKKISKNIDCHVDKKTNVISITLTDQDPKIALTMVDAVKTNLQDFITEYRTNKARNDEAYMEKLHTEAFEQYTKAREKYATFADEYNFVLLESVKSKMEALQDEMQLKYNIYTQVESQLQIAKAKVQERTPAFTTLQNAFMPVKHANKPKVLILAVFVFIAFLIRLAILVKQNYKDIRVA